MESDGINLFDFTYNIVIYLAGSLGILIYFGITEGWRNLNSLIALLTALTAIEVWNFGLGDYSTFQTVSYVPFFCSIIIFISVCRNKLGWMDS